jgi:hypothetical protein
MQSCCGQLDSVLMLGAKTRLVLSVIVLWYMRTGKDGKRKNLEIAATAVTSAVARGASSEEVDALETQAVLTEAKYVKALTGDGTAKRLGWKRNGQINGECMYHAISTVLYA